MLEIRPSNARGHVNMGWLDSFHTFSFGTYRDPRFMGFSHLRVINEDRVEPGKGFHPHGHSNMEIVSYVISGALAHKDSTGTSGVIRPGEVQLMSAGSGIRHSEMNGSNNEKVHFLQIWILPDQEDITPSYDQRDFGRDKGIRLLASRDGRNNSLRIKQNMDLHRVLWDEGTCDSFDVVRARAWVQVVDGTFEVNGTRLGPGDGLAVTETSQLTLVAHSNVEALIFDLA